MSLIIAKYKAELNQSPNKNTTHKYNSTNYTAWIQCMVIQNIPKVVD